MKEYIRNMLNSFYYKNYKVCDETELDNEINIHFKKKDNPYKKLKFHFKKDFTNTSINDIIKFIKLEIQYMEKLMNFDKEIKVENVLILTEYRSLLSDFELLSKQKNIENDNWLIIEYRKPERKIYSLYHYIMDFFKTIGNYLNLSNYDT